MNVLDLSNQPNSSENLNVKITQTLAVSACLKRCSFAINYNGTMYDHTEYVDSATNFVPLAHEFIKKNNININEIQGIVAASGPGSFTGIRVAQSFAKGMSLSLKIPAIGVNYFDVIADIFEQSYSQKLPSTANKPDDERSILIVIRSEKNQAYYQFRSKHYNESGVFAYQNFDKLLNDNCVLIGDAVTELRVHFPQLIKAYEIVDFKNPIHLLKYQPIWMPDLSNVSENFAGGSYVCTAATAHTTKKQFFLRPIYINAQTS